MALSLRKRAAFSDVGIFTASFSTVLFLGRNPSKVLFAAAGRDRDVNNGDRNAIPMRRRSVCCRFLPANLILAGTGILIGNGLSMRVAEGR
jgi:hypothetical protein